MARVCLTFHKTQHHLNRMPGRRSGACFYTRVCMHRERLSAVLPCFRIAVLPLLLPCSGLPTLMNRIRAGNMEGA